MGKGRRGKGEGDTWELSGSVILGGRRWWLEGERTRMIRMEDKWKEREK